jgi:hypothetical protein
MRKPYEPSAHIIAILQSFANHVGRNKWKTTLGNYWAGLATPADVWIEENNLANSLRALRQQAGVGWLTVYKLPLPKDNDKCSNT